MSNPKFVYFFGNGKADGDASMKNELGGKGANLAEMTSLGIPVPPGFTISTEVCKLFYENNRSYPEGLKEAVAANLEALEKLPSFIALIKTSNFFASIDISLSNTLIIFKRFSFNKGLYKIKA